MKAPRGLVLGSILGATLWTLLIFLVSCTSKTITALDDFGCEEMEVYHSSQAPLALDSVVYRDCSTPRP